MGPRAGLDRGRKISLSTGFDPRTLHPVSSRYSDCAFPVAESVCLLLKHAAVFCTEGNVSGKIVPSFETEGE